MNSPLPPLPLRASWLEVDLAAIADNARRLKAIIGPEVELMAMVKANAYGHGAIPCARAAVRGGATWLGVYTPGEGAELRLAGIDVPILVLGPTLPHWAGEAVRHRLTLTASDQESIEALAQAAQEQGALAQVHLKVNTGMTRLGVEPEHATDLARYAVSLSGVRVEGLLTHFAVADTPDARGLPGWGAAFTERQLQTLLDTAAAVERAGIPLRYLHAANSPASVYMPHARLNLVRSGILMYGLEPSPETPRPTGFRPALSWKTRLAFVRDVKPGVFVSYGCQFETTRESRIGVMLVGYADGLRRAPQRWREVLVRGRRVPIVGRVCMDQAMLDVTAVPEVQAGDEVVLIGRQGQEEITAEEVGAAIGSNNYETVTNLSLRVPRLYAGEA